MQLVGSKLLRTFNFQVLTSSSFYELYNYNFSEFRPKDGLFKEDSDSERSCNSFKHALRKDLRGATVE